MKSTELPIPIYLNQQVVFDLLAILDDGFSRLSTIRTSISEGEKNQYGMGASIGASNVFALLGISFSGDRGKEKDAREQKEVSQEKVHTPTSLFAKLRKLLLESGLVREITDAATLNHLTSGEFVEFRAILRKNPLVDTLEGIKSLVEMAVIFDVPSSGAHSGKRKSTKSLKSEMSPVLKQVDGLLKALTSTNTIELLGELLDVDNAKAIIPTNIEFFSRGNALEIIDGEFRVLGKVTRVVLPDTNETINLLRKTAFGRLKPELFENFSVAFADMESAGIRSPKMVTEIGGPAMLVVPIAIFT